MNGETGRRAKRLRKSEDAVRLGPMLFPLQPDRHADDDRFGLLLASDVRHGLRRLADPFYPDAPEGTREEARLVAHGEPNLARSEVHA